MSERARETTAFSMDLDRFILNTELGTEIYVSVVKDFDYVIGMLTEQKYKDCVAIGESFDARSFVAELVTPENLKKIDDANSDAVKGVDLLNPGARELIEYVADDSIGFITTYAKNPETQVRKMTDAGIGEYVPYLVTEQLAKGKIFNGWKDVKGGFNIPLNEITFPVSQYGDIGTELHVDRIAHGDDKASSFVGVPNEGFAGYLYRNPDYEVLPSQKGEVPDSVIVVAGLRQIIEIEKKRKS
jgi:hypothetical protein